MMEAATWLIGRVAAASLVLACSAVVIAIALRLLRCRSAKLSHWAWCCVLLNGVLLWRIPVMMPSPAALPLIATAGSAVIAPIDRSATDVPLAGKAISSQAAENSGRPTAAAASTRVVYGTQLVQDLVREHWATACLIAIWLSGMAILVVRETWSYIQFVTLADCELCIDERWLAEFEEQRAEVQSRVPIGLYVSQTAGPALCRFPSGYRIIVPRGLWSRLSREERVSVLQHELAHLMRGDLYVSLLMHAIAIFHWFNPVSWFALRRIDMYAEYACDDMVRNRGGVPATSLARALVAMGQSPDAPPAFSAGLGRSSLACRIRRCVSQHEVRDPLWQRVLLLACGLVLFAGHVLRPQLIAQEPPDSNAQLARPADSSAPTPRSFSVSDAEFAEAAKAVSTAGGFLRTFHPRAAEEHWLQIILQPKQALLGQGMDDASIDEELLRAIRMLSLDSPTHLHARGCSFLIDDLRLLEDTRLTRLELEGLSIRDQHLQCLASLPELSELSLENTRVTDFGMSMVAQCTPLSSVELRGNARLDAGAIGQLRELPKLTRVAWLDNLNQAVTDQLNAMPDLQQLRLRIDDAAAASALGTLDVLESLQSLELSGAGVGEAELMHVVAHAPNLHTFYLRACQGITLEAIRHIATLNNLEVLALDGSNVTDAGIAMLKPLSKLRWLDLSSTNISDRSLLIIGNMHDLRYLHLMNTNITEDGLELHSLDQLVHLNVQGTYVKTIPDWLRSGERLHLSYDESTIVDNGETGLAVAVAEFNQRAGKSATGKFEPPLTVAEVVAAIRSWDRQRFPVEREIFAAYQEIASTEQFPPGAKLSFSQNWMTPEYHYQVWWIDLDLWLDENRGYTYRIRSRTVSSRELE